MKQVSKAFFAVLMVFTSNTLLAANNSSFEGKYGVFVAVAMVVLLGIFLLLVRLDVKTKLLKRKMNK